MVSEAAARAPRTVSAPDGAVQALLKDRVILVTGGAQGLGAAVCRKLGEAGACVVVTDTNERGAAQIAATLVEGGAEAIARTLDVRDERAARALIDTVVAERGRLDAVVNNAGVDVTKSITELTFEEWDRVLDVNLRGPFVMSKLALEAMGRERRGGHIVNIVSTAACRAWANAAAYHASKWGLLGFTRALHVEGRAVGVKVTAVIAGGMRTPFLLDRFPDIDVNVLQDPENVADAVRFVLAQPKGTVVSELMVLPEQETSWP